MILHKLIKKSDQIVNCAAILLCKLEHQKHKIRFRKKQLDNQAQQIKEQAERIAQLLNDKKDD